MNKIWLLLALVFAGLGCAEPMADDEDVDVAKEALSASSVPQRILSQLVLPAGGNWQMGNKPYFDASGSQGTCSGCLTTLAWLAGPWQMSTPQASSCVQNGPNSATCYLGSFPVNVVCPASLSTSIDSARDTSNVWAPWSTWSQWYGAWAAPVANFDSMYILAGTRAVCSYKPSGANNGYVLIHH